MWTKGWVTALLHTCTSVLRDGFRWTKPWLCEETPPFLQLLSVLLVSDYPSSGAVARTSHGAGPACENLENKGIKLNSL